MKKVFSVAIIIFALFAGACKKDKSTPPPFVADKTLVEVDDSLFITIK